MRVSSVIGTSKGQQ